MAGTWRLLLGAISIALVLAGAMPFIPFLQRIIGTDLPTGRQLAIQVPYPPVVGWADEVR